MGQSNSKARMEVRIGRRCDTWASLVSSGMVHGLIVLDPRTTASRASAYLYVGNVWTKLARHATAHFQPYTATTPTWQSARNICT